MQLSKYLKVYPTDSDKVLLFSTKRLSKVILNKETYQAMKDGNLSAGAEETLENLGFLVKDRNEERREIRDIVELANKNREVCNALVVMNFDCNLDCIYCFEGTQKGKKYLTTQTADAIVDFLDEMSYQKGKFLRVTFYGGEPLMSTKLIKEISRQLIKRANGQKYIANMVSNGLLLTRKRVEELVPLGLQQVKVTIDGIRENHDKYRPLRSGGKSFDTIIKNIKETADLIRIQIGGNFTEDNYKAFPKLLDYFLAEGLTPDKLRHIKFDAIVKTHKNYIIPEFQDVGCEANSEPWVNDASLFLREEILKRGFYTPTAQPGPCTVEYKDDVVINYNGDCYKCPSFMGHDELKIGTVFDGLKDYQESHSIGNWRNQDCMNCDYLLLCFGGCRFMTFLRDGNMKDVDCRKDFYDNSLEQFVKQDIKYIKQISN